MQLGHKKYLKGASHPSQHDYHEGTRKADAVLHETLSPNTQKREEKRRGKGRREERREFFSELRFLAQAHVPSYSGG